MKPRLHFGVLDINALDPLDPVNDPRRREGSGRDNDYDGDMGREHAQYLEDNGARIGGAGVSPWRQIADALPKVQSPSLAPDQPKTTKVESDG